MYSYGFESTSNGSKKRRIENKFLRFLCFYLIPFFILNGIILYFATAKPSYEVVIHDTNDYITTSFTLKVTSPYPYKDLAVSMDGEDIELIQDENDKKTFTASVSKNGVLEISIKNFNGMPAASFEQINTLDDNPPVISDQITEDGILTLKLADTQSGIDYDSIYSVDSYSIAKEALTVDRESGILTFSMDPAGLTIHAKDLAGNEIIASVNVSSGQVVGEDGLPLEDPAEITE